MKTHEAALTHIGLAAAQATSVAEYVTGSESVKSTLIQVGIQALLTFLQFWAARKNSNTDPNGKPLVLDPEKGIYITRNK